MDRKQILTFIAMGLGVFIIAVDITSINVALPAIEKSFTISLGTVEWIINGYIIAFGVLVITAGRLADMYGRKRVFVTGAAIFALASLIGGMAEDAELLIAMRVIQGVSAAVLWPSIVGICYSSVSDSQKGYAVGLIFGVTGTGNAIGPLIGGVLTEFLSWRWVLFINVPLAVLAGLITLYVVSEQSSEEENKGIDFYGIITLSIALVSFLYAIDQSTVWGWLSIKTIGLILFSLLILYIFLRLEKTRGIALIPEVVMKNRYFMLYCLVIATLVPSFFCIFLYMPQYFEKFKHFTPIQAGAALVPCVLIYAIISPLAGRIYNRLGSKNSILLGMVLGGIGVIGIVALGFERSYIYIVPPFLLAGAGLGIGLVSVTTAGVGSVRESMASLAGGIIMMFQLTGAALGIAIATTIFIDTAINDFV
ncbi:MAG: MFS transporter, partial [Thermodesulfobacteriota bacterium]